MILYHCATMYQVLEAIVHHERVHGELDREKTPYQKFTKNYEQ